MKTDISKILEIDRKLRPDLYFKADKIARIIAPEAFQKVTYRGDNSNQNQKTYDARMEYLKAEALRKAFDILKLLGLETETPWEEILEEYHGITG